MTMKFDLAKFDAVLFDLDGVLTQTATLHSAAWKKMFDEYLRKLSEETGTPFREFDDEDYKNYIDGKLRQDGVRSFLASRGIQLPEGSPKDAPSAETVNGLGNRKNILVVKLIANRGVDVFEHSIKWARHLRETGIRTAVVSSSKNCLAALQSAGIEDLFDVRVDGLVAEKLGLPGKPAPDTFLEAARGLGVAPERAVVVEDAIAGVQSGRAGGFGLVIGVDRKGDADSLKAAGADIVVSDLIELGE
jgi:beta-phosphoglucomutase family hydrolase